MSWKRACHIYPGLTDKSVSLMSKVFYFFEWKVVVCSIVFECKIQTNMHLLIVRGNVIYSNFSLLLL